MARTVSVKLAADVAGYVKDIEAAEKATGGLGDKIEETALAAEVGGKGVDGLGRDFKGTARDARDLQGEIKQLDRELVELAAAFALADTAANRAEIFKSIRSKKTEKRKLTQVDDLLPSPAEVEAAGSKVGKELSSSVSKGMSSVEVWGPFAAAAAPLIGAVISGAVIGGVGSAGVIGGVLLAARDPRVKSAGAELGQNLLGQLGKDADVFVGPVLKSINEIEVAFHGMDSEIKRIFSGSSNFLGPLLGGALEGVHGLVDGIDKTIAKAGPVMDALGKSFSIIGHSIGDALDTIAGGSEPASRALLDLARTIGVVIEGIAWLVRGLTEVWGVISFLPDKVGAFERSLVGMDEGQKASTASASVLASVMGTVGKVVLTTGEAAGKAGMQTYDYAQAMADAAAKGHSLYDSQTDVAQAMADAKKAIAENGHSLDVNSQKGRNNRKVLSDLATKLQANFDGYMKVGIGSSEASARANGARANFIKVATQMGATKKQAENLADSMGLIKTKRINFLANTHDAAARIADLKGTIAGVHGKTVNVHVSVTGTERLDALGHRIGGYRAAGGPVKAGHAYVVGERQPEVFIPDRDGTILPSISQYGASAYGGDGASYQSERVMPHWQNAGGGNTIVVAPVFNGPVGSQMQLETWLAGSIDNLRRKGKI